MPVVLPGSLFSVDQSQGVMNDGSAHHIYPCAEESC